MFTGGGSSREVDEKKKMQECKNANRVAVWGYNEVNSREEREKKRRREEKSWGCTESMRKKSRSRNEISWHEGMQQFFGGHAREHRRRKELIGGGLYVWEDERRS